MQAKPHWLWITSRVITGTASLATIVGALWVLGSTMPGDVAAWLGTTSLPDDRKQRILKSITH